MPKKTQTEYLIAIPGEPRSAYLDVTGHSGIRHRFLYNEEHKVMCVEGRPLRGDEFNSRALDIFLADPEQNSVRPVPIRLECTIEEKTPSAPARAPKGSEKEKEKEKEKDDEKTPAEKPPETPPEDPVPQEQQSLIEA